MVAIADIDRSDNVIVSSHYEWPILVDNRFFVDERIPDNGVISPHSLFWVAATDRFQLRVASSSSRGNMWLKRQSQRLPGRTASDA